MSRIHLLLALLAFVLPTAAATAGSLNIPVGRDSTLLNLETGERIVRGRSVGNVRIDTDEVHRKCSKADRGFDGLVRLEPDSRAYGWKIKFLCLKRWETIAGTETATDVKLAERDDAKPGEDAEGS